jgi:hypothetical protein
MVPGEIFMHPIQGSRVILLQITSGVHLVFIFLVLLIHLALDEIVALIDLVALLVLVALCYSCTL